MKINYSKTKELLLRPLLKLSVPGLDIEHNLEFLGLNSSESILLTTCLEIFTLTIFVLQPILACIILKG